MQNGAKTKIPKGTPKQEIAWAKEREEKERKNKDADAKEEEATPSKPKAK